MRGEQRGMWKEATVSYPADHREVNKIRWMRDEWITSLPIPYGVTDLPPSERFRSCATGVMQIRQQGVGLHNRVNTNYLCSHCNT
jgi:hypothetical protein